jgi:wobble nucleotide-excising tRNase
MDFDKYFSTKLYFMIKKIDIKKFGVFNSYQWDKEIGKNEGFKKLNIIYGRNYSGKTTLARIFRCIENQCLHSDYPEGEFAITMTDGSVITQKNLGAFGTDKMVRVYNSDFIKTNLSWLRNNDGTIVPLRCFAFFQGRKMRAPAVKRLCGGAGHYSCG